MILKFKLSKIQSEVVRRTLDKLENAHHARVAWFDDYSLDGNVLSIHELDLISVLSHRQHNSNNEFELFRLRKAAINKLASRYKRTQDEIKKKNIRMWLESFGKIWPGVDCEADLTMKPLQPR